MTVGRPVKRELTQSRVPDEGITFITLLNKVAAHPWALSFTSFLMTALLIRGDRLFVF